jgi:serine/threonine protein kinase
MAPEVLFRQNHSFPVDFFAVGVIAYECMLGSRPYLGLDRKEIKDKVIAKQAQVRRGEVPPGWSLEAADFINRMILRKAGERLGAKGIEEVKGHPWLRNFPWTKLSSKMISPPFTPFFRPEYCDQGEVTID